MTKVTITQGEKYPTYFLDDLPHVPGWTPPLFEVPDAQLERWRKVIVEYEKVQEEMEVTYVTGRDE